MNDPLVGLTVDAESRPPGIVLVVSGELDRSNVDAFAGVVERRCAAVTGDVAIDLSDVEFMGLVAVDVLRHARRRLATAGRRLSVWRVSPAVQRTFALAGDPFDERRARTCDDGASPVGAGAGLLVAGPRRT
jgi:anti-anti-sigma factor